MTVREKITLRPEIRGWCKVCDVRGWKYGCVISPTGIVHYVDTDSTCCGHNATADGWWWPL